jgi:hypothetical protein
LTFAGAQRHALDEMRRLFGKEKVGSPKTMKRVWNRKQIRKTDEPDQLKDEPELFWQIAVMDELYFQDLLRRAFKAVLDPEFMEARAFARGRGNRGTVGQ